MNGGNGEPESISTLHPQYQQPIANMLGPQIASWLQGGLPQFPGYDQVGDVYDPAITNQYFQSAFVDPTMRALTGPHGAIPRIGAAGAQRGTYFSSGRQQQEADVASDAFTGLGNAYADLMYSNLGAKESEWERTQPSGQIASQALNWLGTPMMMTYQEPSSPWGALGGAGLGAGLGALLALPTGGLSVGMGALLGGQLGGSVGGAIYN